MPRPGEAPLESPLSLDALRVLDAIDREGSFAAAAARLHRVPSAITYTIRRLEEELGVELFDRSGHRAVLTEAGRLVLARGRELLNAAEALRAATRGLGEGWEPSFTIAVNSLLHLEPVLALVAEFHAAHPDVALALTEEVLDGAWDALETGRADLAIGAHGEAPRGITARAFGTPDWVYVCAPEHPAAALEAPIEVSQLAGLTAVIAQDTARERPGRSTGLFDQHRRVSVPHLAWKIAAQRAGLGVGWVPRHRVAADLAAGRLVELELTEPRSAEPLQLAWRRGRKGRALQWFLERLEAMDLEALLLREP